jgi:hypothetical protein
MGRPLGSINKQNSDTVDVEAVISAPAIISHTGTHPVIRRAQDELRVTAEQDSENPLSFTIRQLATQAAVFVNLDNCRDMATGEITYDALRSKLRQFGFVV